MIKDLYLSRAQIFQWKSAVRVYVYFAYYIYQWVKCIKVIYLHMYVSPRCSHSVPGKLISVVEINTTPSAPLTAEAQSLVKIKALDPNKVEENQRQDFNQPLWICTQMYLGDSFQLGKQTLPYLMK